MLPARLSAARLRQQQCCRALSSGATALPTSPASAAVREAAAKLAGATVGAARTVFRFRGLEHVSTPTDGPTTFSSSRVPDLETAYAVQAEVGRILSALPPPAPRRAGWKVGATSAAARAKMGLAEPFFGPIYTTNITRAPAPFAVVGEGAGAGAGGGDSSGSTLSSSSSSSSSPPSSPPPPQQQTATFVHTLSVAGTPLWALRGAELEVAFEIGRDVGPRPDEGQGVGGAASPSISGAGPSAPWPPQPLRPAGGAAGVGETAPEHKLRRRWCADSILSRVWFVYPAIEIVSSRVVAGAGTGAEAGPLVRIADQAQHGHSLLAPSLYMTPEQYALFRARSGGFADAAVCGAVLSVDGVARAEGSGAAVMGDPAAALAWLADALLDRGEMLRAGDVVLSGTMTGLTPLTVPPGPGPEARASATRPAAAPASEAAEEGAGAVAAAAPAPAPHRPFTLVAGEFRGFGKVEVKIAA